MPPPKPPKPPPPPPQPPPPRDPPPQPPPIIGPIHQPLPPPPRRLILLPEPLDLAIRKINRKTPSKIQMATPLISSSDRRMGRICGAPESVTPLSSAMYLASCQAAAVTPLL